MCWWNFCCGGAGPYTHMMFSNDLDELWRADHGATVRDIAAQTGGAVVICGDPGTDNYNVRQYTSAGALSWSITYPHTSGPFRATAVGINTGNGNVWVEGIINSGGTRTVRKYTNGGVEISGSPFPLAASSSSTYHGFEFTSTYVYHAQPNVSNGPIRRMDYAASTISTITTGSNLVDFDVDTNNSIYHVAGDIEVYDSTDSFVGAYQPTGLGVTAFLSAVAVVEPDLFYAGVQRNSPAEPHVAKAGTPISGGLYTELWDLDVTNGAATGFNVSDMAVDSSGNCFAVSQAWGSNNTAVYKISPSGVLLATATFGGVARCVAVDSSDRVLVGGDRFEP